MNITFDMAVKLALARVDSLAKSAGDQFSLLEEQTKELEHGWLFFYNTTDYLSTKNVSDSLAGNGPIFVSKDGEVIELRSGEDWQSPRSSESA